MEPKHHPVRCARLLFPCDTTRLCKRGGEDVALGAGAKASEVPVMSRIVSGWRCSYRQVEDPIRPNAVAVDRRLERLSKALTPIRHRWAKSARKAPPLSAAAKLKAKTNKATKAKAASKLLRDLRTAA